MNFTWVAILIAAVLFGAMLATFELGRRIGMTRLAKDPDGLAKGVGAAEGAVFALLGLLMAFTFSGAASRFEGRRLLIAEESNAIGTAYLRLDLLPAETRPPIQAMFKRYANLRATVYRDAEHMDEVKARLAAGAALQSDIWKSVVAACRLPGGSPQATQLVLPALNEMIDITETRQMQTANHPPAVIFWLLGALSVLGALLVGYTASSNKRRTWIHQVTFALVMSLAIYVIVDIEYPRLGMIRVNGADQLLLDLANSLR
jgi:hypothetical protein